MLYSGRPMSAALTHRPSHSASAGMSGMVTIGLPFVGLRVARFTGPPRPIPPLKSTSSGRTRSRRSPIAALLIPVLGVDRADGLDARHADGAGARLDPVQVRQHRVP